MTEITRVPLQPIAKGSLAKLWLGVGAAAAIAAGLAYASVPAAVKIVTLSPGTGASPTLDDVALISYKGTLSDGKVFDENKQAVFPVAGVIPGFTKALVQMQRGGHYKVFIPAALGYGAKAAGPIPANSDLTFEIGLIDFKSRAEIEQQQRMMQQMRAQAEGGARMHGHAMPQGGPDLPPGVPGAPMPDGAGPQGQ